MKTNKVHFFFLIVEAVLCLAGGVHTLASYIYLLTNKFTTSFPPYCCVFSLIPYAIAFCAVGIIWLVTFLFFKIKRKKATC